ncbi:MAG: PilZ domain-containing protein [Deltaproteobacteria bacterium]|nr:PilZ domain-containing protein [Deltaproteobacteria bacterium]
MSRETNHGVARSCPQAGGLSHTSPHPEASGAPAPIQEPLLILHRLTLLQCKTQFLEERGVKVVSSRSVRHTCALLDAARNICAVVVDVSVGSQAPERIHRHHLGTAARADHLQQFVGCTSSRQPTLRQRSRRLGLASVLIWPEGAFEELVRFFAGLPTFKFARQAERAVVNETFGSPDDELSGRLINLSATGAMIEADAPLGVGSTIHLELDVPGTDHRASIAGSVVWTEAAGQRTRLGIAFRDLSPAIQEAIAAFVHNLNEIRFGTGAEGRERPGQASRCATVQVGRERSRRVDYFRLEGDLQPQARLVPKKPFFAPYEIGERLLLRRVPGAPGQALQVEVTGRFFLDDERLDSRVGWIVRRVKNSDSMTNG